MRSKLSFDVLINETFDLRLLIELHESFVALIYVNALLFRLCGLCDVDFIDDINTSSSFAILYFNRELP